MKTTIKADQLTETLYGIQNLINEGLLRFNEEGVSLVTADPAMVALINLEIPADSLEEYELDQESEVYEEYSQERDDGEGMLVGVNIENFYRLANLMEGEITITVEDADIVMESEDDRFTLPVLNLSIDDIPATDNLEHNLKADLDISTFKELVKKLSVASESATFKLDDEAVLETVADGDQMSIESEYTLNGLEVFTDESDNKYEEAESMFSLDYLSKARKMFGKLSTCDTVEIRLGDRFPVEMIHEDSRENLKFVLAPRIEED